MRFPIFWDAVEEIEFAFVVAISGKFGVQRRQKLTHTEENKEKRCGGENRAVHFPCSSLACLASIDSPFPLSHVHDPPISRRRGMWGVGYVLKDRWVLEEQIAHGSYSTVWCALLLSLLLGSFPPLALLLCSNSHFSSHCTPLRRAQDAKTGQVVAVKNLRVSMQLESAKRALREIEMLKHFVGSENVRCILDFSVIGVRTGVDFEFLGF